jgi:hypothetical protein
MSVITCITCQPIEMMLNVRYFMIFLGVRNIAMGEKIMEEQGAT